MYTISPADPARQFPPRAPCMLTQPRFASPPAHAKKAGDISPAQCSRTRRYAVGTAAAAVAAGTRVDVAARVRTFGTFTIVRRQRVQTYTFFTTPLIVRRRCCTFTRKRRLVCRFEWLTLLPYCGRRLHTSQRLDIGNDPFILNGARRPRSSPDHPALNKQIPVACSSRSRADQHRSPRLPCGRLTARKRDDTISSRVVSPLYWTRATCAASRPQHRCRPTRHQISITWRKCPRNRASTARARMGRHLAGTPRSATRSLFEPCGTVDFETPSVEKVSADSAQVTNIVVVAQRTGAHRETEGGSSPRTYGSTLLLALRARATTLATQQPPSVYNGQDFKRAILAGHAWLEQHREAINALNVFPVPDGDTGTNMSLTMRSATAAIADSTEMSAGVVSAQLARGALMGARGNSGVILSQILRGVSVGLDGKDSFNPTEFAAALQEGAKLAYGAVIKPVEGTILTVVRESAEAAVASAARGSDMQTTLGDTVTAAKAAVAKTPDLLPLLKQAGVVDAGGQGLASILEGMWRFSRGESVQMTRAEQTRGARRDPSRRHHHRRRVRLRGRLPPPRRKPRRRSPSATPSPRWAASPPSSPATPRCSRSTPTPKRRARSSTTASASAACKTSISRTCKSRACATPPRAPASMAARRQHRESGCVTSHPVRPERAADASRRRDRHRRRHVGRRLEQALPKPRRRRTRPRRPDDEPQHARATASRRGLPRVQGDPAAEQQQHHPQRASGAGRSPARSSTSCPATRCRKGVSALLAFSPEATSRPTAPRWTPPLAASSPPRSPKPFARRSSTR